MHKYLWRREVVERLLIKFQEHENLYNPQHPHYADNRKRYKSLFKIYEDLKVLDDKITVEAIRAKIQTIRAQYRKELRDLENSKRSEVRFRSVPKPKLWCFDQLEFLKPYSYSRNTKSNIDSSEIFEDMPKFISFSTMETMNKILWKRELVELLLEKFREHENLYNPQHPHYMDKTKRVSSLLKICKELKAVNNKITVEAIKAKIHSLRSQYRREMREIEESIERNVAGIEEVYEPKLWCFEHLEFLRPYTLSRQSNSSVFSYQEDSDDVANNEESKAEDVYQETNSSTDTSELLEPHFPKKNSTPNIDSDQEELHDTPEFIENVMMNKKLWTRELIDALLKKFREHENLYNTKHPHYANRAKRVNSLFKIYRDLKILDNSITIEAIKQKIHTLRSQYARELREIEKSKRNCVRVEDVYEPKLWYFKQMEFLRPYVSSRNSTSKIDSCLKESPYIANSKGSNIVIEDVGQELWTPDITEFLKPRSSKRKSTKNALSDDKTENPISNISLGAEMDQSNMRAGSVSQETNAGKETADVHEMLGPSKKQKVASKLEESWEKVKSTIVKRLNERNNYEWLGQQVSFDINSIKNEDLRDEAVWKIQSLLRNAKLADKAASNENALKAQTFPNEEDPLSFGTL